MVLSALPEPPRHFLVLDTFSGSASEDFLAKNLEVTGGEAAEAGEERVDADVEIGGEDGEEAHEDVEEDVDGERDLLDEAVDEGRKLLWHGVLHFRLQNGVDDVSDER